MYSSDNSGDAHANFVHACLYGSVPKSIEPGILASWKRSLHSYALHPSSANPPHVLSEADLRAYRESLDPFRRFARGSLEQLAAQVVDAGYLVLLADATGVAIDFISSPLLEKDFQRSGLYLGSRWSESEVGTNAVGTCIVEKAAMTVHHAEHFRKLSTKLTCSAAPILGPTGDVLGVLDASALSSPDDRRSQHLVLQLVKRTAMTIENAYFLDRFRGDWVLRIMSNREWADLAVDVSEDGLLAVDGSGRIVGANRAALAALGPEAVKGGLLNEPLERIIDARIDDLERQSLNQVGIAIPIHVLANNRGVFITVRAPRSGAKVPRAGSTASSSKPAGSSPFALAELAGADPSMLRNVYQVRRVLNQSIPVMLQGETGTGKEAFAKAMHEASDRCHGPFVALNCAALPESLIESELFGYKEGAFTGARNKGMRGKFLLADGGTLFLDEIGDMPIQLQTRLLRVLEEREVTPLGADKAIPVDFRLISATHRNLNELVSSGDFREDLYYRLNGIKLFLPTLNDRIDKADLIKKMCSAEVMHAGRNGVVCFSDAAWQALMSYAWPGNIRELRNCMRSALALCEHGVIELNDLPSDILAALGLGSRAQKRNTIAATPLATATEPFESAEIHSEVSAEARALTVALRAHHWNVTRTATSLGVCRATIYRKMERYGIIPPNRAE